MLQLKYMIKIYVGLYMGLWGQKSMGKFFMGEGVMNFVKGV